MCGRADGWPGAFDRERLSPRLRDEERPPSSIGWRAYRAPASAESDQKGSVCRIEEIWPHGGRASWLVLRGGRQARRRAGKAKTGRAGRTQRAATVCQLNNRVRSGRLGPRDELDCNEGEAGSVELSDGQKERMGCSSRALAARSGSLAGFHPLSPSSHCCPKASCKTAMFPSLL